MANGPTGAALSVAFSQERSWIDQGIVSNDNSNHLFARGVSEFYGPSCVAPKTVRSPDARVCHRLGFHGSFLFPRICSEIKSSRDDSRAGNLISHHGARH